MGSFFCGKSAFWGVARAVFWLRFVILRLGVKPCLPCSCGLVFQRRRMPSPRAARRPYVYITRRVIAGRRGRERTGMALPSGQGRDRGNEGSRIRGFKGQGFERKTQGIADLGFRIADLKRGADLQGPLCGPFGPNAVELAARRARPTWPGPRRPRATVDGRPPKAGHHEIERVWCLAIDRCYSGCLEILPDTNGTAVVFEP